MRQHYANRGPRSFFTIPAEFLRNKNLTATERLFLIALSTLVHYETGVGVVTHRELQARTGLSSRTLSSCIKKLGELRYFKCVFFRSMEVRPEGYNQFQFTLSKSPLASVVNQAQ